MSLLTIDQVHHVAVDEMQQTHAEEISMLNAIDELATRYEKDSGLQGELEKSLDAYVAHVKAHFANEERLMRLYAFPPYMMHKGEHDRVMDELDAVVLRWKEQGELAGIIAYLRGSVEWIVNHIQTMDNMTALYISQRQASEAKA